MNHKRKSIIEANEISELRTFSLGGYKQKVLIEGKYRTNPIVIVLHGGAGFPVPFGVGSRGMFPELTDRFIMVYWDQLGCGVNNHKIDESFSSDDFTEMAIDLIQEIRKEFPENTISLYGVSWGSIIAAKVALKVPHMLYRVLTYAQVLKQLIFNDEVYKTLENSKLPKKSRKRLESIKNSEQHTLHELKAVIKLMLKYTEGYQSKAGEKYPLRKIFYGILTSPDYSLKDFLALAKNGYTNSKSIFLDMMNIDLSDVLCNIQIPYLILQGDTDIVTSTTMIATFKESIQNDSLLIHRIPNSSHEPSKMAMDYIIKDGFDFLDSRKGILL